MSPRVAAVLLALGGCASLQPPQTADAFRREASGALLPRTGALEVARPLREVAGAFRSKAPECLDLTATATIKTITHFREIIRTYVTTYKPTVVESAQRFELHVQWRTQGEIHLSPPPAVFWYESQDGTVRNVAVNAAGPVVINRKGNLN